MTSDIGDIAARHAARDSLAQQLDAFYRDLDAAIADRAPVCTNRGLCCNFDAYGHDLFVTTAELAHFIAGHHDTWRSPSNERHCPWQIDGICTAREHRPMGCRIFFCDETSTAWQHAEYEKRLAELKRIGDALGIEYRYTEWLSALKSVPPGAVHEITGTAPDHREGEFVDPCSLPVIESK